MKNSKHRSGGYTTQRRVDTGKELTVTAVIRFLADNHQMDSWGGALWAISNGTLKRQINGNFLKGPVFYEKN